MANCVNCNGTGKITVKDKKGKLHSIACGACLGTGEKPQQPGD